MIALRENDESSVFIGASSDEAILIKTEDFDMPNFIHLKDIGNQPDDVLVFRIEGDLWLIELNGLH